jgi:hypothetical protein
MSDEAGTPREKRSSVILKALVRSPNAPAGVERRVRNLSASGACMDHAGEYAPGDGLTLLIGEVTDLVASVAWATDRLVGVRFARTIDTEAARARRPERAAIKSGWMAEMNHAYRKVG